MCTEKYKVCTEYSMSNQEKRWKENKTEPRNRAKLSSNR